jgi:hypothetical protein
MIEQIPYMLHRPSWQVLRQFLLFPVSPPRSIVLRLK